MTDISIAIPIPYDEIRAFCERNHIRRLALFGSVLREDFGPESDVDMLVEFEANHAITLLDLAGMQIELEHLTGRSVDLMTRGFINPRYRDAVEIEALPIYVAP